MNIIIIRDRFFLWLINYCSLYHFLFIQKPSHSHYEYILIRITFIRLFRYNEQRFFSCFVFFGPKKLRNEARDAVSIGKWMKDRDGDSRSDQIQVFVSRSLWIQNPMSWRWWSYREGDAMSTKLQEWRPLTRYQMWYLCLFSVVVV